MACAQPFEILNPHFNEFGYYQFWKKYIEVPCGWCLNCRLDRQNWLTDAMTYEQKKYDYICSFVTFTYDDIYIQDLSNVNDDDFYFYNGEIIPYYSERELVYSLRRKDARDFLKRLRSKINYLYETHNIKNVDLCRKDFKFCCSGEYGDSFGRPHYHFVFFGLDWQFCRELFESCWKKGLIDSKPVTPGCFQYVTKYLTKQAHGDQAKQLYDDKYIERPFFTHSLGLGKGIILDQYDFIKKHNLSYLTDNNSLRPIPIYYRNHFYKSRPKVSYRDTANNMLQAGISSDLDPDMWYRSGTTKIKYSIKKMNQFRKDQALLRHRQLEKQCENKGIPITPLNFYQLESCDTRNLANKANKLNNCPIGLRFIDLPQYNIPRLPDGSVDFDLYLYGDVVPF